ncbi:MAG TPA: exodeoxyribonuclease VII large subunit [Hyphomonadaceae bacterium]|nr:exodeoxyribonuclease VII large subunit [Hyphomonadaceae bacterium]
MDEFSESQNPPPHGDNMPEMSVSELANALKRTVEENYSFVRVRGELGRVVLAKSGHLYFDIKDESATLNTIMWKGNASKLPFKPEEGLEVVAEGKLSTYPGRSNYQMIADKLRPAGVGALMQLLEERKKKLAAEGLFAAERKKAIPFLPAVIGVVTSPTGAVIRDILHRVRDRFPVHVLIWPALVQGEKAAAEVEVGIRGFNALKPGGAIPRPDVIIVARGGGSIEDLWPFNEECVVRAVADSEIPLISAVGHETDTTLIDFASDRRAPTPTGAAEMALPVRSELIAHVQTLGGRLTRRLTGTVEKRKLELRSAGARLPKLDALLQRPRQRLDLASQRFGGSLSRMVARKRAKFDAAGGGLRPAALRREIVGKRAEVERLSARLQPALGRRLKRLHDALREQSRVLDSVSYERVLARGFALVTTDDGALVRSAGAIADGDKLKLRFADGEVGVTAGGGSGGPKAPGPAPAAPEVQRPRIRRRTTGSDQGSLF